MCELLESAYDGWLCDVLLFELHTGLSGVLARGGRTEKRECVPGGITRPAWCDSGAFGRFVWSVVTIVSGTGALHMVSVYLMNC